MNYGYIFSFFIGAAFSVLLVTYGETISTESFIRAFQQSFETVIQSCAQ